MQAKRLRVKKWGGGVRAKRLRVKKIDETIRGETTRGETSRGGGNVLLPNFSNSSSCFLLSDRTYNPYSNRGNI